jgi:hypothetical protein
MYFSTPPLDIEDAPADARHVGGVRTVLPQFIVLHHTGPWPALVWLTTDDRSDVSAHRYIEPYKPIYKLVDDTRIANTQGYADVGPWSDKKPANFNRVCLSIEGCFNPQVDKVWSLDVVYKMACQTVEWVGRYGLLPIVYHWQVDDRKDDPARFPRSLFDTMVMRGIALGLVDKLTNWRDITLDDWAPRL